MLMRMLGVPWKVRLAIALLIIIVVLIIQFT
jgi:hypothetical protein